MIEQLEHTYIQSEKPLAFRHEFYNGAETAQIKDDIISYLGEYRFEVPDHEYKMGFSEGQLVDPNTNESMVSKAQKAVELRRALDLGTTREEAEVEGLVSLQTQFLENPTGTAIWFSPPGKEEDGYGDYGFAYTGKKEGDKIRMSAIRLESPSIGDFNLIAKSVWNQKEEMSAEGFLKTPKVLDIPEDRVREYVYGVFEVKPEEEKTIFQKALEKMDGAINDSTVILKYGTPEQKKKAIVVLENMSIELKSRLSESEEYGVVFQEEYNPISLTEAMQTPKYVAEPPLVKGSCGMTGKIESSNFLGKLLSPMDSNLNKSNQEWFTCPKCSYKADGPVGNRCPGCGLTKEQFAEEGGESCD
ncbi:MAG TPA: hypothetical protein VES68_01055 [Candidatus Sulfotelmatobacter sp.]|nr:hypothetical protein [Candidatus Sulfotelmatobacter sp.]